MVELLKILGMLLIVICHITTDLFSNHLSVEGSTEYLIQISSQISIPQYFICLLAFFGGALGNFLFLIPSVYFMIGKEQCDYKKLLRILFDAWVISILWLLSILIYKKGDVSLKYIIKAIFPTSFNNNWYITSYIIFALICPLLNKALSHLNCRTFIPVLVFVILFYFVIGFVTNIYNSFTPICFCVSFIIMYFFKNYKHDLIDNVKLNIVLLLVGFFGLIAFLAILNALSFYFRIGNLTRWYSMANPFLFLSGFSAFNLALKAKFKSKFINYLSSLSLLVYVIHGNLLFQDYLRQKWWIYVYNNYGIQQILLWLLTVSVVLFIISIIAALIYRFSLGKIVKWISDKCYLLISKIMILLQDKIAGKDNKSTETNTLNN